MPEEMFSLDDLIFQSGAKLKYSYDPDGDKWIHEIAVENIRYLDDAWPFPICCVEGIRSCPPENCGGPTGFAEMLKALKNAKHPRHEEFLTQYADFDPDRFSFEKVNKLFKVKGPVDRRGNIVLPISKQERVPKKETDDPLHVLGRKLKKKAAS